MPCSGQSLELEKVATNVPVPQTQGSHLFPTDLEQAGESLRIMGSTCQIQWVKK